MKKICTRRRSSTGNRGVRDGVGHKRDILPPEVLMRIGPRPSNNPSDLGRWYSALLSELAKLVMTTGRYVEMFRVTRDVARTHRSLMSWSGQLSRNAVGNNASTGSVHRLRTIR